MERTCRVCEEPELQYLRNIFSVANRQILTKLRACADIEVIENDSLPKYICFQCCENLESAYQFKLQAELTDRKFRNAILHASVKAEDLPPQFDSAILQSKELRQVERKTMNEYQPVVYQDGDIIVEIENEFEGEHIADSSISDSEQQAYEDENLTEYLGETETVTDENKNSSNVWSVDISQVDNVNQLDHAIDDSSYILDESEVQYLDDTAGDSETALEGEESVESFIDSDALCSNLKEISGDTESREVGYSLETIQSCAELNEGLEKDDKTHLRNQPQTEKSFQCDTCSEVFVEYLEFNTHKKTHGDQRYQCDFCSKWFSKRYRLKNHMVIHEHSATRFPCTQCDKKYTTQCNLLRHIRHFHQKERRYQCSVCGMSFARSTILKQHLAVHSEERNFACEQCGKPFKTQYYLDVHKKSHLPPSMRPKRPRKQYKPVESKQFSCTYCFKMCKSTALYKSHLRTHTGEKPYECEVCHKKFGFQQSLRTHLRLHSGLKPYSCEECGLSFRQIGHLNGHKLVHSGEKKYKCAYCEKRFALKCNLLVHQRIHTGETPYSCLMCSKKFHDSNGLKRHQNQHLKQAGGIDDVEYLTVERPREETELNVQDLQEPEDSMREMNIYLDEDGNQYTHIIEIRQEDEI